MPSLQFLCLDTIIKHFHRFYLAFTSSKDPRWQRNMRFLQKRFSNELACELLEDPKKTDVYFDFLFNEHLTIVDFDWFYESRYLKPIDGIFCRLPNLLRIKFNSCGDEILESVTKFCPKIIEINATESGRDLTDKGMKYLCDLKNGELPCPKLKNIVAFGSSVSNEGAECLIRSLPSIEKFVYKFLPRVLHSIYTKSVFQHQKVTLFNLTVLDLSDHRSVRDYTEVIKTCITLCPKLESIICRLFRQEYLDIIIYSCIRLKKLDLYFFTRTNIDNHLKAGGHNLTVLRISNCSLSASVLAVHCPALKQLKVFSVDFTDEDDDDLQLFFPSLTSLELGVDPTVTKTFHLLSSSSPKLEIVGFNCFDLEDEPINSEMKNDILKWCRNPAAKRMKFYDAHIEMNFLKDIFLNCDSLEWMGLECCKFDVPNPEEILNCLAKKHPKRPVIDLLSGDENRTIINQKWYFSVTEF